MQTKRIVLVRNVVGAIAASLLVNGLIFGTGLATATPASDKVSFAPPGWVIGCVWIGLFGLLGLARGRLMASRDYRTSTWLTGLMAWCLAYPLTSAGFDPAYGELVNTVSLLFAAIVTSRLWRADRRTGALLIPVVVWMAFAVILGAALSCHGNFISCN